MEHTKHLWRAGLLVILALASFAIARHFLVPETFGDYGFYRASSLQEFMALPVEHGGPTSCMPCHEAEQKERDGGAHKAVGCEVCHMPLASHVRPGANDQLEKYADMPSNKSRQLCQTCHLRVKARPKDFPQFEPVAHLLELEAIEPGDPVPDQSCFLCHSQHSPKIE